MARAIFWLACAISTAISAAIILGLMVLAMVAYAPDAEAHDFYSFRCCSGTQDCGPVPDSSVRETATGYEVTFPNGRVEVVPYADSRINFTPPDHEAQYHVCTVGGRPDGMLLCIYVPGRGA